MVRYKTGGGSAQAVSHVTSGTYHRSIVSQSGLTFAAGTEVEVTQIATDIIADDGRDALFSWIRAKIYVMDRDGRFMYEYALIRCDKDEAAQDLNTDVVVENLHKQGRILRRDVMMACDPDGGSVPPIKIELYNVKLDDDEELRLLVRPIHGGGAATGEIQGLLEWREVGA